MRRNMLRRCSKANFMSLHCCTAQGAGRTLGLYLFKNSYLVAGACNRLDIAIEIREIKVGSKEVTINSSTHRISVCKMAAAHTCYSPNRFGATRDTPCHSSDGETSACYAYCDMCFDNNLCLAQQGAKIITRGSCTDETWQSPECPQYCADGKNLSGSRQNLFRRSQSTRGAG